MAKNKSAPKMAQPKPANKNALPQNFVLIGERVEENKNIYISQYVCKEIHKFTRNKTVNESGGILVGDVIEEFGKINIIINGFVEAKYCESTPTTLKFTHKTWNYCHKEINKKFSGQKIVGWIHTHPNYGIFLSNYDKFIHENFFREDYQIAYVVDPIQNIEGFYFWINGRIERCKGFYVFDKTGKKITVDKQKDKLKRESDGIFDIKILIIAILAISVIFLLVSNMVQNSEIKNLKNDLIIMANQNYSLGQQLSDLTARLTALEQSDSPRADAQEIEETTAENYNANIDKTVSDASSKAAVAGED